MESHIRGWAIHINRFNRENRLVRSTSRVGDGETAGAN
jgi:hypothetical protein